MSRAARAGYEWVEAHAGLLMRHESRVNELRERADRHHIGWVTGRLSVNARDPNQHARVIGDAVRLARILQALGSDVLTLACSQYGYSDDPRQFHFQAKLLSEIGSAVFAETGLYCAYVLDGRTAIDIHKLLTITDRRHVKFCLDTFVLEQLGVDAVTLILNHSDRVLQVDVRNESLMASTETTMSDGGHVRAVVSALCRARFDGWVILHERAPLRSSEVDVGAGLKRVKQWLSVLPVEADPSINTTGQAAMPANSFVVLSQGPSENRRTSPLPESHVRHRGPRGLDGWSLPDPAFSPFFFTDLLDYQDVTNLVDAIIPETDTPGALAGRANEFVDLMAWNAPFEAELIGRELRAFVDLCYRNYGLRFSQMNPQQKRQLLTSLTLDGDTPETHRAMDFFQRVRAGALYAYYTASPHGLLHELGYKGNTYVNQFTGCTHAEHGGGK